MRGICLLLAAGEGRRLGAGPKAFVEVAGVPILRRAAHAAARAVLVEGLVVAVPPDLMSEALAALDGLQAPYSVVAGGATRQESARAALDAAGDPEAVAVHDAARALCPPELFNAVLAALDDAEAAIPVDEVRDTLKRVDGDFVAATVDRTELRAAQTPQAFRTSVYRLAHEAASGPPATDDAALVERIGVKVRTVPGSPSNLKITTQTDIAVAEALVR